MSGIQTLPQTTDSRWITNPKHTPIGLTLYGRVGIKISATVAVVDSTAGFFTNLAYAGAEGAITVADTYTTLADLTGGGFLCNVVSPIYDLTAFRPSIRITVDGVETVLSPSADVTHRMIFGYILPAVATTTLAGVYNETHVLLPNGANDNGFHADRIGGIEIVNPNAAGCSLLTPHKILSHGYPALRFEESLKVEVKANLLSSTAVHKQSACTYIMDI